MLDRVKAAVKKFPYLEPTARMFFYRALEIKSKPKWRKLASQSEVKLELGSGPKRGSDGWVTVDVAGADICYDLRKGIPLPDESVDVLYSSHMLEHISYDELIPFLRECRRAMKPGAYFSVCVPDFRRLVDCYVKGELFSPREEWWGPASVNTKSAIDQLNYAAYMNGQHKYLFDEQNLVNTFVDAGFSRVEVRDFISGLDLPERHKYSIYSCAYK